MIENEYSNYLKDIRDKNEFPSYKSVFIILNDILDLDLTPSSLNIGYRIQKCTSYFRNIKNQVKKDIANKKEIYDRNIRQYQYICKFNHSLQFELGEIEQIQQQILNQLNNDFIKD